MKKRWFPISILGAFGLLYIVLGVVALVDGKPWAMAGKSGTAPVSPEVTILAGAVFVAGSIYLCLAKRKKEPIQPPQTTRGKAPRV